MTRDQAIQAALRQIPLPPQITIRAWRPTDLPAIRELAVVEGWTTLRDRPDDGLRAWQHSWPTVVATHQQQIIGFVRAITDTAVTMYIAELLVAPAWRGQRIGHSLLALCHLLYPTTRFDLLSTGHADSFYESEGFGPFRGFRKRFEPMPSSD